VSVLSMTWATGVSAAPLARMPATLTFRLATCETSSISSPSETASSSRALGSITI
jgi:hypothetical protein